VSAFVPVDRDKKSDELGFSRVPSGMRTKRSMYCPVGEQANDYRVTGENDLSKINRVYVCAVP